MAWSLLQTKTASKTLAAGTTATVSLGNTTNGSLVVVGCMNDSASLGGITGVSCSGMTFTKIDESQTGDTFFNGSLWYAYNITGATTPTLTVTFAAGLIGGAIIREYSGATTTDPLNRFITAKEVSADAAPTSGLTKLPSAKNDLVIGFAGTGDSGNTYTAGTGFTDITQLAVGSTVDLGMENIDVYHPPRSENAIFSITNISVWVCTVATFRMQPETSKHTSALFSSQFVNMADNTSTRYNGLSSSMFGDYGWGTTEFNQSSTVPGNFTLKNFQAYASAPPGTGKSWTITVRKSTDGGTSFSDTDLTCTIADGAQWAVDTEHFATFAAGDLISVKSVPSGTPTVSKISTYVETEHASLNQQMFLSTGQNTYVNAGVNLYSCIMGAPENFGVLDRNVGVVACDGTFKAIYVSLDAAPGASKSWYWDLYKNSASDANSPQVTISGTNKTGSDTAHSLSVTAGDRITLRAFPTNTPATVRAAIGILFEATNKGESFFVGANSGNQNVVGDPAYNNPNGAGRGSWNTSEANLATWMAGPVRVNKLYAWQTAVSGAAKSWTYELKINGVYQLGATISGASDVSASSATASVPLVHNPGNQSLVRASQTGGAAGSEAKLGIRMFYDASQPTGTSGWFKA